MKSTDDPVRRRLRLRKLCARHAGIVTPLLLALLLFRGATRALVEST